MGTHDDETLFAESAIAFAGACCGGLFLGVLVRLFGTGVMETWGFAGAFSAVSACIEFVRLCVRRRSAREAVALALADGIGIFIGFGLTRFLLLFA